LPPERRHSIGSTPHVRQSRRLAEHDERAEVAALALGSGRFAAAFDTLTSWRIGCTSEQRHRIGYLALALLRAPAPTTTCSMRSARMTRPTRPPSCCAHNHTRGPVPIVPIVPIVPDVPIHIAYVVRTVPPEWAFLSINLPHQGGAGVRL